MKNLLQRRKLFRVTCVAVKEEAFRSDYAMLCDADDDLDHTEAGAFVSAQDVFGRQIDASTRASRRRSLPTKDK
jgi:hypothetical protein